MDQVLWLVRYTPFIEKMQLLIDGSYHISPVIRKYQQKIRYFGDLRNQMVHGFRMDQHHYLEVSDFAVEQIKEVYAHLTQPKTITELFWKDGVHTCQLDQPLSEVLTMMYTHKLTHIPIYDHSFQFVDILDESTVVHWLQQHQWTIDITRVRISDMQLTESYDDYAFVPIDINVYELRDLFIKDIMQDTHKRLWVVLVTQTWDRNEPLKALVSVIDLPMLDHYFIH